MRSCTQDQNPRSYSASKKTKVYSRPTEKASVDWIKLFTLSHNKGHSKIIGGLEKRKSSAISPLKEMSPYPPTPSRCPSGITSLFLHYILFTEKCWESNWILPSFPSVYNETKDSEKPDGLRFVRGAKIQSSRARLITPRLRVRTLYKGAWKEKSTRKGALR
jgi:hypothetical protein